MNTLNILERLRIARGMSMRDLSKETGVSTRTIVRLENGEKAITLTLAKLAKGLGVEVDELLELAETPAPPRSVKVNSNLINELNRRSNQPLNSDLSHEQVEADMENFIDGLFQPAAAAR